MRSRSLDPQTPIFRGTSANRYEQGLGELWWRFHLRKAVGYVLKNDAPMLLVGAVGDVYGFSDVQYIDQSIFIASRELYRGRRTLRPVMKPRVPGRFIQEIAGFEILGC